MGMGTRPIWAGYRNIFVPIGSTHTLPVKSWVGHGYNDVPTGIPIPYPYTTADMWTKASSQAVQRQQSTVTDVQLNHFPLVSPIAIPDLTPQSPRSSQSLRQPRHTASLLIPMDPSSLAASLPFSSRLSLPRPWEPVALCTIRPSPSLGRIGSGSDEHQGADVASRTVAVMSAAAGTLIQACTTTPANNHDGSDSPLQC
jgi:hypothetical protein